MTRAQSTDLTTRLQARELTGQSKGPTVFDLIQRQKPEIERALPKQMSAERLIRVVLTEIRKTPRLGECTPESLLGALMLSAQLKLEPGPLNLVSYIPRHNKSTGKTEVQFQIGYPGWSDLVTRDTSRVLNVIPRTVYLNDEFDYQFGSKAFIKHRPARGERGESFAWYAVAALANGSEVFDVMFRDEVEHHRKFSQNADGSTWTEHYDAMAMKTVLIRLCKYLPKTPEIGAAMAVDGIVQSAVQALDEVVAGLPMQPIDQGDETVEGEATEVEQPEGEQTCLEGTDA